jgi:hypothetical protein
MDAPKRVPTSHLAFGPLAHRPSRAHLLLRAQSEAVLEALRTSPYRECRPLEFKALFGYILGNRDGIDNWHLIPTSRVAPLDATSPQCAGAAESLKRTSRCASLEASSAKGATGLAAAPNTWLNCSGFKRIPSIGATGVAKPL